MYLVPLIRSNRAIAASLIYPSHPLQAIAISEIISVIGPFFNPKLFARIIGTTMAMMYNPEFASSYIKYYNDLNTKYNEAEICTLLLFVLTLSLQYIK